MQCLRIPPIFYHQRPETKHPWPGDQWSGEGRPHQSVPSPGGRVGNGRRPWPADSQARRRKVTAWRCGCFYNIYPDILIFTDLHVIYRIIWGYLGSKLGNYPNFLRVGLDPKDRNLSETCAFLTRTCLSCSCKILKFLRPVRWQGLKDVWV